MTQYLAFIPLRGGSLSIPRKNIKPLAGRPLCDWTIAACLASGVFDEVWVSTDDDEIAAVAAKCGARVHRRSPETATATASTESAMLDFAAKHPGFAVMALVQATSPLTLPQHFQEARAQFEAAQADSLVTVTRRHGFRWSAEGQALNYEPARRPRRQDWPGELVENGAFYFTRQEVLTGQRCRLGGRMATYLMPGHTAFEIDEPDDWLILEALVRRHGYYPPRRKVRLLALDADGVLNDGGFYYTNQGEAMKKFSTRDAHGLAMLRARGVEVGIITGEATGVTEARAARIGITRIASGVSKKLPVLEQWRQELGLDWAEVAYMGDDLPDLACLQAAGLALCPSDAEPEILAEADYVAARPGGRGAVRDAVNWILGLGLVE